MNAYSQSGHVVASTGQGEHAALSPIITPLYSTISDPYGRQSIVGMSHSNHLLSDSNQQLFGGWQQEEAEAPDESHVHTLQPRRKRRGLLEGTPVDEQQLHDEADILAQQDTYDEHGMDEHEHEGEGVEGEDGDGEADGSGDGDGEGFHGDDHDGVLMNQEGDATPGIGAGDGNDVGEGEMSELNDSGTFEHDTSMEQHTPPSSSYDSSTFAYQANFSPVPKARTPTFSYSSHAHLSPAHAPRTPTHAPPPPHLYSPAYTAANATTNSIPNGNSSILPPAATSGAQSPAAVGGQSPLHSNYYHLASSPYHPSSSSHSPNPYAQSYSYPSASGGASPRHPAYSYGASSPRHEGIQSVGMRLDGLARSGRLSSMIACSKEWSMDAMKMPMHMPNYDTQASAKQREALLAIDRHLRRRYVFSVLDSDMVVRGIVYDKTDSSLIITVAEIYSLSGAPFVPSPSVPLPHLSSLSAPQENFENLTDLHIRGECHAAEMQAILNHKDKNKERGGEREEEPPPSIDRFHIGDSVKALVISVDIHSERIYLSLNNQRLRSSMHKLGLLPKKDTPIHAPSLPPSANKTPSSTPLQTSVTPSSNLYDSSSLYAPLPAPAVATNSMLLSYSTTLPSQPTLSLYSPSSTSHTSTLPLSSLHSYSTPSQSPSTAAASLFPSAYQNYLATNTAGAAAGGRSSAGGSAVPPSFSSSTSSSASANAGTSASYSSTSSYFPPANKPKKKLHKDQSFLPILHHSAFFKNPESIYIMLKAYQANPYGSLLPKPMSGHISLCCYACALMASKLMMCLLLSACHARHCFSV